MKNERQVVIDIGAKLGLGESDFDSWYKVNTRDIIRVSSAGLLHRYGNSVMNLLVAAFPEHKWEKSKFQAKPQNYWEDMANLRKGLVELGKTLGIAEENFEAWYSIRFRTLSAVGGAYLLKKAGNSVANLVALAFPEHAWDRVRFRRKNSDFWDSAEAQRSLVLEIGGKLGGISASTLDAWYGVTPRAFIKQGGGDILRKYGHLRVALETLISDHEWLPWKFHSRDYDWFWREPRHLKKLVTYAEGKLGIRENTDWERVTKKQFEEIGLKGIIKDEAQLLELLRIVYPDFDWARVPMKFEGPTDQ